MNGALIKTTNYFRNQMLGGQGKGRVGPLSVRSGTGVWNLQTLLQTLLGW